MRGRYTLQEYNEPKSKVIIDEVSDKEDLAVLVKKMGVKISIQKPKIYDRIKSQFPYVEWENGLVIVADNTIYSKFPVIRDVLAHELVHIRQQDIIGNDVWWNQYLADDKFRLDQEVEAYQEQARYIRKHVEQTNRDWRRMAIKRIAVELSGELYGNIISYDDAMELLSK